MEIFGHLVGIETSGHGADGLENVVNNDSVEVLLQRLWDRAGSRSGGARHVLSHFHLLIWFGFVRWYCGTRVGNTVNLIGIIGMVLVHLRHGIIRKF